MQRFIPARAGNSALVSLAPIHVEVHPRACGELSFYKGLITSSRLRTTVGARGVHLATSSS